MIRLEHEVEIARPVSEVFAYVTDMARLPEWQATAISGRLESERMEKGARIVEVRKLLGRQLESAMDVTEYEPERQFAVEVTDGPVRYRANQTFESADGGTRVHVVFEGEPAGYFPLSDDDVEHQIRRELEEDFRSLKLMLESGAA
jgi:uncharacterized membrane protein